MTKPKRPPTQRALCALLVACLLSLGCTAGQTRYTESFLTVFDTATQVTLYAADQNAAAARTRAVEEALLFYHRLYDVYHAYEGVNNLYTVNANAGVAPVAVDAAILDLVAFGKEVYALSGGRVNIAMGSVLALWHDAREAGLADPANAALPPMDALREAARHTSIDDVIVDRAAGTLYLTDPAMRLDVGALAKGFAGQRVADALRAEGTTSMLLNLGGNVCCIGARADGTPWRVGVQDPASQEVLCTVRMQDRCLVTSGVYQRYYTVAGQTYHHIIDPETLLPGAYFAAVSVLCADGGMADALSTALFLMPLAEGQALVDSLDGMEALWVFPDGESVYSAGFAACLDGA